MNESIDIEIDFSSQSDLYQVTRLLDTSLIRFRLAVDRFFSTMAKGDNETYCFLIIGCLHIRRGLLTDALGYFHTGLTVPGITPDEAMALFFQLGRVNEKLKNFTEATYYYYRVHRMNPGYLSVGRRLQVVTDLTEIPEAKAG